MIPEFSSLFQLLTSTHAHFFIALPLLWPAKIFKDNASVSKIQKPNKPEKAEKLWSGHPDVLPYLGITGSAAEQGRGFWGIRNFSIKIHAVSINLFSLYATSRSSFWRLKGNLIIFPRHYLYIIFKMNPAVFLLFCVVGGSLVHEEEVGMSKTVTPWHGV